MKSYLVYLVMYHNYFPILLFFNLLKYIYLLYTYIMRYTQKIYVAYTHLKT